MKNLPNVITIIRIILIPFYTLPFIYNNIYGNNSLVYGFLLFVLLSLTDFLDGYLARKYDFVSNFGKIIDPLADKILVYSAFFLLVYLQRFPLWVILILLFREILVTIHRNAAQNKGVAIAAVMSGKIKTTIQMITIITAFLNYIYKDMLFGIDYYLIYLTLIVTIYSGIDYYLKNKNKISTKTFINKIFVYFLSIFRIGKTPIAPGTLGSLFAVFVYIWFKNFFVHFGFYNILWLVPLFVISAIISNNSEELFGESDSSEIIIDEFTGQVIPLLFLPVSFFYILSAFVIFRILDIWKPFPISKIDKINNGWGIMFDDVIAGLITLGILQLFIQLG